MKKYDEFIKNSEKEMTDLLSRLIAVKSVMSEAKPGMPFGEENARVLQVMKEAADSLGFKTNIKDNYYLTADYLPSGCDSIKLGILSHLDVVPAGDGWTKNPFTAVTEDGRIYGRGATDDKGPAVSALYALYAVKELGTKLSGGVRLIFGSNEENGSEDIAYYLKNDVMPPMVFTPDAEYPVINCEKGMVRCEFKACTKGGIIKDIKGGQVINAVPSKACCILKGIDIDTVNAAVTDNGCKVDIKKINAEEVEIIVSGKSAHASTPQSGINAIAALFELLSRLPLTESEKETVTGISALYPLGEYDGSSLDMKMSDDLGALTHVLSMVTTDENGYTVFSTDTRFPVCSSTEEINLRMQKALSAYNFEITSFKGSEPHYTNPDSPLIKALLKVYQSRTGKKGECIAIGGGTYVHEIEGGVAFGVEHEGFDYHIHGADEFVPIEELSENTAIFAEAIEEICG